MTTPQRLRAPGPNPTPRAVLRMDRGRVLLDMSAIAPASRWFTVAELQAVNGVEALALGWKLPTPFDSGLVYDFPRPLEPLQGCELPPHFMDNIIALTEILNSRPSERQKSRDLYVDDLYDQIEMAVAS